MQDLSTVMEDRLWCSKAEMRVKAMFSPRLFMSAETYKRPRYADAKSSVSKADIRSFKKPDSDTWIGLSQILWAERALRELPESDPRHSHLVTRLKREKVLLRRRTANLNGLPSTGRTTQFIDLPSEIREIIYSHIMGEFDVVKPTRRDILSTRDSSFSSDFQRSGLPSLAMVYPSLEPEISSLLRDHYKNCTFQFDFSSDKGLEDFNFWSEHCPSEAAAARRISLDYSRASTSHSDASLSTATSFSLTESGDVDQTGAIVESDCCNCNECTIKTDFIPESDTGIAVTTVQVDDPSATKHQVDERLVKAVTNFWKVQRWQSGGSCVARGKTSYC